jgi:hypothetical protein
MVRANVNAIAPCDPQYIEALGLAVHNFAWLEHHIIWLIEELEPNYWEEYAAKAKTAGAQLTATVIKRGNVAHSYDARGLLSRRAVFGPNGTAIYDMRGRQVSFTPDIRR